MSQICPRDRLFDAIRLLPQSSDEGSCSEYADDDSKFESEVMSAQCCRPLYFDQRAVK